MKNKIKQQLDFAKNQAMSQYLTDRRPLKYFRSHGLAVQTALNAWWTQIFGANSHLTLLAIGGFGRNELYPYSDLDLAIVSPDALTEVEQNQITQFIQLLWDNQLKPALKSGSLKQLCESAQHDLTADTAFLETRPLSGCLKLAKQFEISINNQRDIAKFTEGKLLEMRQRHAKQPAFALEPHLKNGIGGLRDIHTMMWLAKVQNLGDTFSSFQKNQVINHIETGMLRSSHRTLARLRIELHLAAGREEDRLTFDLQNKVAHNLGYQGNAQQNVEQLMRQFYRAAKNIVQLNQIMLPMLRERIYLTYPRVTHDIDADYYQINHQIAIKNPLLFETQPEHIFGIVQKLQAHQLHHIAPKTLRAWWTAVQKLDSTFYENETHRAQFLSFFQMGTGLTAVMRLLNVYGVLAKYVPAWDKIVGLLQHDLFHIYPVDDHILMVLRNVRRLAIEAHSHELPFASALMQGFEKKYVLYLAAFFHDIAKGRNGDHAILGVADAQRFAQDHRLPEPDGALLAWLVEHHLLFSLVAQKQDIHDPEVLRQFCQIVNTPEKLTALYLLTVADIRGTNPKIWNSWKAQLLQTLFQAASRYLAGEQASLATLQISRKQQAHDLLKQNNHDDKRIRQLWQALGETYFAYFDDSQLAWHLPELIEHISSPCIRIQNHADPLRILVYMPNGTRLFTRICRIISQHGVDIVAAKALVTAHDFILDEFVVQLPEHCQSHEGGARISEKLIAELNQFAQTQHDIKPLNPIAPSRRAKHQPIAPHVQLTPNPEHPEWYTLEVVAINRSALLADITEVFAQHRARLYHARIATLADRVEDIFVLHCPHWQNTDQEWAFQRDVLAVLQ